MNNYEKKFVVRQAECILNQCDLDKENKTQKQISNIELKIQNKRLKRKIIFWKICASIAILLLIIYLI